MQRLAKFDVSRQFSARWSQNLAQITFGVLCGASMIGLRSGFDLWAPSSGPFALIYPTVLLATLYGHWRAGLTAFALTFWWAWYFVLPAPSSFTFVDPTDPARVVLNGICNLVVIVFAESFRKAARSSMDETSKSADMRLTLLTELEHRTKNNFAQVASLLELQKRTLADTSLHGPIDDAVGRVRTFAEAYASPADEQSNVSEVEIQPYLDALLERLDAAAIPENIRLHREIEALTLPRDDAVAIGLYVNEALSNCLKYAFPNGRPGTVGIYFHVRDNCWNLVIEDDGVGVINDTGDRGGIGSRLMAAFAQQVGAAHHVESLDTGFRVGMSSSVEQTAVTEG